MATIELTGADDGRTVDLQTGDVVVVRLDENPTTGYRWVLEPDGEPVMALQSSDYVQPDGAGVGGGGRRLLTLKAVKPGTETVRLKLSRKWEAGGPIPKMFAVTFRVQG